MKKTNLSVVLATFNEERNLRECLESIKEIAEEIIIVDGASTDKTVEIAKTYDAKVLVTTNPPIFHINKQKALGLAKNDWILQLDADERVSPELAEEIIKIITMTDEEIVANQKKLKNRVLFLRHQALLERRDGAYEKEGKYAGFFIPRLNFFLGTYLRYGGVYPDGVIRLIKKGHAHFPCKDVHEQIKVEGKVGWLEHPLYHYDSPTFKRYLKRNSRYIDLVVNDLKEKNIRKNPINMLQYMIVQPMWWFLLTFVRHKGFLDGWRGFVFSFFSALRFPRAYARFLKQA